MTTAPVSAPPAPPLTLNEALTLQAWLDLSREKGYEPSLREVCARIGRPTAHAHVARMWLQPAADAGILIYHEGVARGIRLAVPEEEARTILARCLPSEYLTHRETSDANVA